MEEPDLVVESHAFDSANALGDEQSVAEPQQRVDRIPRRPSRPDGEPKVA